MKITIGNQSLDAVLCEGSINIEDGTYPFIDIATPAPLTGAQIQEIQQTGFAALDDIGTVIRKFTGYADLYECRSIFVRKGSPEQELTEAREEIATLRAQVADLQDKTRRALV